MKETESGIVTAICEYLAARRHFFWRSNNIPAPLRTGDTFAFRRMPVHAMKGIPDIIVIRDGKFIGIEAKTSTGRLSEHQVEFGRLCQEHNATYLVARSIDDVQRAGL